VRLAREDTEFTEEQRKAPPPDGLAEAAALAVVLETTAPRRLCRGALGDKTWIAVEKKWGAWSGPANAPALGAEILRVVQQVLDAPYLLPTTLREKLARPVATGEGDGSSGGSGSANTANKPTCFSLKSLFSHMADRPS